MVQVVVFWEGHTHPYKIWLTREEFEDMQWNPEVRTIWEVEEQ